MLKKSASGILASLRGSTYRSIRLATSLAAVLQEGLFEHPASAFSSCPKRISYRSSDAGTHPTRKILRVLSLAGFLLVGWLAIQFTHMSEMNAWAGSPPSSKSTKAAGDAERGRAVFNGKGVCYYCHGIDGKQGSTTATRSRHSRTYRATQSSTGRSEKSEGAAPEDRQAARACNPGRPSRHRHVPGYHHDQPGTHRHVGLPCSPQE